MATVLVIDGSHSIRETIAILLGHEHRVLACASPGEAAHTADPALLIAGLPPHDAAGVCSQLAATWPAIPLLLLNRPGDLESSDLGDPARRVLFLPKPFDAGGLRSAVRAALAPRPRAAPAPRREHFLTYPFVARSAAALLRQAPDLMVPLLLVAEPGSGSLDVARAVHDCARAPRGLHIIACRGLAPRQLEETLPTAAGVFLEGVHETPRAAQFDVLALVRGHLPIAGDGPLRVYASIPRPLDDLMAEEVLLPELAYALGAFPVHLAPLRERVSDLDDLVPMLSATIAERVGLAGVSYSAAAMERLRSYLWFGNVAELEAVLTRTLATRRPQVVAAEDLVFLPEQVTAAAAPAAPAAPAAGPVAASASAPRLEVLLGELAHELRNPMVTIKTFAQHLDSVLADPEVRARFATLVNEAVGRMDGLLERVLEFARFRAPVMVPVALGPLLDRVLAEHGEELARKSVRVERNGAMPDTVEADEAQVQFALRSLIAGLVGELVPHEPLRITAPGSGTLELQARAGPAAAARLTAFVEGADRDGGETPTLPFALAAALLERNRGQLRVRSGGEGTTVITVTFAGA